MVATSEQAEHGLVTPDERDIPRIREMQNFLREELPHCAQLVAADGKRLDIPESVCELLRQIVPLMAAGATIGIVPLHQELTTQQAADLLNVSRPFLIKLLDGGAIPYRRLGTHRRVRFDDVMAYKRRRSAERMKALDELSAMAESYGDYD
jgi:excisionase family DNA binding protein